VALPCSGTYRARKVLEDLLARQLGNTSSLPERAGLERTRSIGTWLKDYGVELDLQPLPKLGG